MGYVEELRKLVGHRPLILVGAVVIVIDGEGRILLQKRRYPYGSWGLPGGLMELGESTEDTVRREVKEETGLEIGELNLIDISSGPKNFVVAQNGDEFYVVTVSYYTNEVYGILEVDEEESIECNFINISELPDNIVKSHKQIINKYLDITTNSNTIKNILTDEV